MPSYVVAFPEFTEADRAVIDAMRARFDPLHQRLPPHVTLVFATELDLMRVEVHAPAFTCVFRRVTVEVDAFSGAHCVFLVADEGGPEIVALHDALYTGALAAELRSDLPYIPHVTVARTATAEEAHRVAASLGEIAIRAAIDRVEIVTTVDGGLRTVRTIALAH